MLVMREKNQGYTKIDTVSPNLNLVSFKSSQNLKYTQ